MTPEERTWFEAGRRARADLGLPPPSARFYALLGAAVRQRRARNAQSAGGDPAPKAT